MGVTIAELSGELDLTCAAALREQLLDRPPTPTAAPSPMTSSAPAWAFLTNGKTGSDGLRPHDDLLAEFPFLGPPNP